MAGNLAFTSSSPRPTSSKALIMISGSWFADCAGGQLHAVADQIVLVGGDGRAGRSRPFGLQQQRPDRRRAWRTGCGRIPARRTPRRSHTSGSPRSSRIRSARCPCGLRRRAREQLDAARRRSSGRPASCLPSDATKRVGRQAQSLTMHLLAVRLDELGDAAGRSRPSHPALNQ